MNYQQEYDEYWSRPDRWGSHSFQENPSDIAGQIERICGRGRVLDVGCGMGLLVHTLTDRGHEAHGVDVAQRVVDEGNRRLPGCFHAGSILSLPFPDEAFDTVVSTDCLEHIAEADAPKALGELHRVSRRFAFIRLATTPDRDGRWHLTIRDRAWWENQFFAAGFRKHPLSQLIVPYEALEKEGWQVTILLEKIPAAALARHPLSALKAERDLHMDMLRETGRRSDAHIARYMFAREHLPKAGLVLDAACGLGCGSALLARSAGSSVRVVGLDISDYAVDYARANFQPHLPNVEFHHGDVMDLSRFADSSVDLVVSFETLEHLRQPSAFLREVNRVLRPEGRFICSVPNQWADETGKDPSPWHFHVFDFAKLAALIQEHFQFQAAYSQTAGGGRILPDAPRALRQAAFPDIPANEQAEWWLAVAASRKNADAKHQSPANGIDLVSQSRLKASHQERVEAAAPAIAARSRTKIEKESWRTQAQEGELLFHKKNQWRPGPNFARDNAVLLRHFGFDPESCRGKTVLDLGAGSKLRTKFFAGASLIAIEPLASRYVSEIPWCDLPDASEWYSAPAEERIDQCGNKADLLISINVLDHCYDFEKVIQNIRHYLRDDGTAFLSFDKHETADEMHPLELNETICEQIFRASGLVVEKFTTGLAGHKTYGHGPYALNYWLRKGPIPLKNEVPSPARPGLARAAWLLCSNSNHVKLFAPVARQLQARGWKPAFVSLDNFYGQGSARALRELGWERLELPTLTPDGNWHERTQGERDPWNAEAAVATEAMFAANAPDALVVGNDTGFLEQLFVKTAKRFGVHTMLLQEGALRSKPFLEGEPLMGDSGCDLICTWGEGLADRLRARGVGGQIEVAGNPLFDLPLPPRPESVAAVRETVLLIGQCFGKYGEYSMEQEHAVNEKLIRAILQRTNYRLVFKTHPQQNPKFYMELRQRLAGKFELMTSGESLASIQTSDLVVSVASTMALEAFRLGVPTLTLHYLAPFRVPDLERLSGGCWSENDFNRFLDQPSSWKNSSAVPAASEAITRELFFKLDGKACERVCIALGNLLRTRPDSVPAPALTVILCSYNRAATLARCLEQFLEQTVPTENWEVVLVNDGSTDNTHEIVQQKQWPFQFRYIRQENTGLAGARNTAIAAARGKILLLINDDTIAAPDLIEKHLAAQKAHPHSMVLGAFEYEPWTLESAFMQVVNRSTIVFGYRDLAPGGTYDHMFSYTCNLSVPAEAYQQAGLFDTSFKSYGAEDTEMGYRLEKAGYHVVYCPEARAGHAHALTLDEFIKRQLNVGSNFARFFRIHPEVVRQPRWGRTGETSRFQIECSVEAQEKEMRKCVQEIRSLETAWKNSGAEKRAEIVGKMQPLVMQITGYYWMAGLAKGMAREELNSFSQLPDRRLPMVPGEFSRELASGLVLSVIVPTYNRLPVLQQCLAALTAQSLAPDRFEVLLCDDGSTDGTEAFMSGYSAPFRVQYLRDKNQGPGVARNRGIAHARGKIAVIINDDTMLSPTALEQHLACHLQLNGAPVAVMGAYWPSKKCAPTPLQCVVDEIFFPREDLEPNRLHDFRALWTCNLSIAVQALRDVVGFDSRFYLAAAEDTDLGIRLAEQFGFQILYRPDIIAFHEHQHTFDSFKRSCLARGRMTYHLVAKHPWLIPQWFGITEFDGPGITQFKERVAQLGAGAEEIESRMRAIEQLFMEAGPKADPAAARRLALQIRPELAKLSLFYNRAGTALELEKETHALDARFTEDFYYKRFPLRDSRANRPAFSIVLPADGEAGLEAALAGLLRQSCRSWELILADRTRDGKLRDCAKALVGNSLRCHYLHCPAGTEPEAIRAGAEIGRGNLFLVLQPGAVLHEHFLHHVFHASQNSDAGLLCPNELGTKAPAESFRAGATPPPFSIVKAVLWKRFYSREICGADWWTHLCERITRAGFPSKSVPDALIDAPEKATPRKSAAPANDCSPEESLAMLLASPNWRESVLAKMEKPSPGLVSYLRQRVSAAKAGGHAELATRIEQIIRDLETAFPEQKAGDLAAPELSVVIPTCNRKDKLLRCLQKLSCQSLPAAQFEVIVVDDGSTDGTEELLRARKFPFALRHFKQANKGPAAARNRGIQQARGRIVVFLGDDIYAPPDFLNDHLRHHRLFPDDHEALLGHIAWAGESPVTPFMEFITGPAGAQFAFGTIPDADDVDHLHFYTSNVSLKKKFLESEQPVFDEGYAHAAYEDTDLGYRLKRHGMRLRYRPRIIAGHDHPTDAGRFSQRQFRAGQMAVRFAAKFPETSIALENKHCLNAIGGNRAQLLDEAADKKLLAECARLERAAKNPRAITQEQKIQLEKIYRQILQRAYARGVFSATLGGKSSLETPASSQPGPATPKVSIVIPTFNRLDLTRACLMALRANTPAGDFEIIVVDNASTDGTREFLAAEQTAGRLTAILNETNLGFARACNQGAAAARGKYVLFLNNDTEVRPGWLEPLVQTAEADPRIGALGSKLLFADNTIQHAGVVLLDDRAHGDPLRAHHIFSRQPHDLPEANRSRICPALTAACLFVRKEIFEQAGGFDEEFWNGYEDVDLCLKISAAGKLLVYQPASVVTHHESQSGPERFRQARQNIERLHQKWLGKVQPDFVVQENGQIKSTGTGRFADYPPAKSAEEKNPRAASIIILALNQLARTRACLESIAAHTPSPHEVIVVDNGSTDGTPEFLKQWRAANPNCTVIRNETNRGFAAGNNQGLAVAKGEILVLLNNDTIVTPGWIEGMTAVLDADAGVGVVGPVSNRVSGPQQIPTNYTSDAAMFDFAKSWRDQNQGQSQTVTRLVGFCLLFKRAVLDAIGGLDESFGSGNFEDDDFCLRAKFAGFGSRIARGVFIHHTGSQTFRGAKIDYRQAMLRNWDLFRAKWNLPDDVVLERGYPVPDTKPEHVVLKVALPSLNLTHKVSGEKYWLEGAQALTPVKMVVPPVARLGNLDEARSFFGQNKLEPAWDAVLAAISIRPFHLEAHLLLAEIARAAGDGKSAKLCAQQARDLAPNWKAPKQFLKGGPKHSTSNIQHPTSNLDWLKLPESIGNRQSAIGNRLSVCLIVKNEEKFLPQCLKSIHGLARQIVVVDTGSTDRTVEIAKEHGAEVHSFAWCDDFSAARNAALEHATGDWILMLDADEELPATEHARLQADMKCADVIAFRLPLINKGEEAQGSHCVPRLFRNAPGVYYYSRIHEQVFPSLVQIGKAWGLKTAIGTAELIHHGYAKEIVRDRNKVERNLKLLRQAVVEFPNDANLQMNLGLELVHSDDLPAGLVHYREAFRLMSAQAPSEVTPELREVLLTQFTCHLYKVRAHDEIVQVLASPLAKQGGLTASLHFALGLAFFELKKFREAADEMRQCLAKRKQPSLAPINTDILTAVPHHCLALSLMKLGDHAGAEKKFKSGLAGGGDAPSPKSASGEAPLPQLKLDYAKFLAGQNRQVEALQQLNELVAANRRNAAAWRLGGEIALGSACGVKTSNPNAPSDDSTPQAKPEFLEFARDWTGEAIRQLPEDGVIIAQRAEALLLSQQTTEALPLWSRAVNGQRPPRALAAQIICATAASQPVEKLRDAPEEAAVSRAFVDWYRRLVAAGARDTVVHLNSRVEMLRPIVPLAAGVLDGVIAATR